MAVTAPMDTLISTPVRRGRVPFAVALFIIALMIPTSATFFIGPILLTPMKILLVLLTVPVTLQVLASRPRLHDWLFLGFVGWVSMCTMINYGGGGITVAGIFLTANLGAYGLAATALRRVEDIIRTTQAMTFGVLLLGVLALPENILQVNYLQDAISAYTDYWPKLQTDFRLGMLRASSVFSHPIMYGTFCASVLSFAWYTQQTGAGRVLWVVLVTAATLTALSSGPLLVLMLQLGLILTERFTRSVKNRFRLFLAAAIALYVLLDIASDRGPIKLVLSTMTFNPGTAYYRLLIWEHGSDDVLRHPIFGFRPETWTRLYWMRSSVDNFWLVTAFRGGFPAVFLLLGAVVAVLVALFRQPDQDLPPKLAGMRRAAAYSLLALCICAGTVHYFGKIEPLFPFYFGIAVAMARILREHAARGPDPATLSPRDATPARPPGRRTVL